MSASESYRLTVEDETRVLDRIRSLWRDGSPAVLRRPETRAAIRRSACHAIGCSEADLRDVELAWIDEQIRIEVGR